MHKTPDRSRLPGRRTVWRWHFYAGVLCAPVVIVLAASGSVYLFKSELEAWIDADIDARAASDLPARPPSAQVAAALAARPGGTLKAYELPRGDGATRVLVTADGADERIYVHPATLTILGRVAERDRLMRQVFRLHGELWLGEYGSFLVELAASWTVVLILTGLWLWWPRSVRAAGVLWPRLGVGRRTAWRDLHAVTGFWVAGLALVLLASGLPWSRSWGSYLKLVRRLTGTAAAMQDWNNGGERRGGEHAGHGGTRRRGRGDTGRPLTAEELGRLDTVCGAVAELPLDPPVLVAPQPEGTTWSVKSETANRPRRVELVVAGDTGAVLGRRDFSDRHLIDRIVGYGIAFHEGRLFGWPNQLLGLFAALGLMLVAASGWVMWWRRRPPGVLGAPPGSVSGRPAWPLVVVIIVIGMWLPMFGTSLVAVLGIEWLVLRRLPGVRTWLGLA